MSLMNHGNVNFMTQLVYLTDVSVTDLSYNNCVFHGLLNSKNRAEAEQLDN